MKTRVVCGLVIAAAVFVVVFVLETLDVLEPWEWKTWDLRLRLFSHPERASPDIVLVLIDQQSLDVYEKEMALSWPWPREMHAYLIAFLKRGGARAVFLDFLFTEPSVYGPEDDQALARAMAEAGNVFLPLSLTQKASSSWDSFADLPGRFFLPEKEVSKTRSYPAESVLLPVRHLLEAARGVGNTTFAQDRDGVFRRMPVVFSLGGRLIPSLPAALARFLSREKALASIPVDRDGQMVIRYHGPTGTYPGYSAAALINSMAMIQEGKSPLVPAQTFRDKVVLIGGSAPGILDLRPTPFSPVSPGVEVLAAALDNLLQRDFVRSPPRIAAVLYLGLVCLLCAVGTSALQKTVHAVLFLLLCGLILGGVTWGAFTSGIWLSFVAPCAGVVLSFSAATLANYSLEGRQRRFLKSAFKHYLSPQVIERVLEDPSLLRLGGEKRVISSFFSDVAGFTSIAESLPPEDLVRLLNDYLSEMTDIILSEGGTVDKYEGDAIIAFWNAPLEQPDHALRACRAALQCQRRLEELRPELESRYGHSLTMRIGINSGPAVVGNMGSRSRFDYTAIGDTVNLASRLEGACKVYGVPILAGETTHQLVEHEMAAREVDLIRVVGKSRPERVFQILGEKRDLSEDEAGALEIFPKALEAYRMRRWEEARRLFRSLSLQEKGLCRLYLERIAHFEKDPPPPDWSGVFDMEQK